MTFMLGAYRYATWALEPLAGQALRARARAGKEDGPRLSERFGRTHASRSPGPLIWLHGASMGETRVLLTLHRALAEERPDAHFLFTTGTRTSAALCAQVAPARAQHQYAPLDAPGPVRRFLSHWRPDVGIFAESDLWPNLVSEARARGVRLALVNARLSPKSLAAWGRLPASAGQLFSAFDAVIAADARTAEGLSALRAAPVAAPGNLKLAAPAPPADAARLEALKRAIGARPTWLAASTHDGEEEIALAAHAELCAARPDALLILCPRHPERGAAAAALAQNAPRRSEGAAPEATRSVYVADTMGEMGVLFSAAPVTLMAGSLLAHLKGHNPAEPTQLGCAVLSGPYVESFADLYGDLVASGGARFVRTVAELAAGIAWAWADPAGRAAQVTAAQEVVGTGAAALEATLDALRPLLPARAPA